MPTSLPILFPPVPGPGPFAGGGGADPPGNLHVLEAEAVRENVIRLRFDDFIYYSGLEDLADSLAADVTYGVAPRYVITPLTETKGRDGLPAQPVTALYAQLTADGLPLLTTKGKITDDGLIQTDELFVVTDRPLSPYPAQYTITVFKVWDAARHNIVSPAVTFQFDGLRKEITIPTGESIPRNRDIANPQARSAAITSGVQLTDDLLVLGTITYDETGDLAFDEGLTSYRKRILRRLITRKNGFLHLPGYGIGVRAYIKRLATGAAKQTLLAEIEAQISREPETQAVSALMFQKGPGLFRIEIKAQTRSGQKIKVDRLVSL